MKKELVGLISILMIFVLCGCATFREVGTAYWHKNRLQEIETAYQNGDIEKKEYLSLKNEADQIREKHISENQRYCLYCGGYHARYPYGYHFTYNNRYGYSYRHGHHYRRHYYGYHH